MTFVHGPEEAVFLDTKPAKLRFFLGYTDEFAPEDGSDQVRVTTRGRGIHDVGAINVYVYEFERLACSATGIQPKHFARTMQTNS